MKTKIIQLSCLLLVPLFGYLLSSCNAGVAEGNMGTQIELVFIGESAEFCEDFFDERHTLNLSITVDKIIDTSTGGTEVHFTDYLAIDNDIEFGETYDIEIPETGGFAIIVQATSSQCFTCCDGKCFSSGTGKPFIRGIELFDESPSGIIYIKMELLDCDCC